MYKMSAKVHWLYFANYKFMWIDLLIFSLSDDPNTKLVVNGRFVLGQLAEIHADAFKNGEKKNLFHGLVHLDEEKFLKPDFGYNKDNIVHAIVSTFSCDSCSIVVV